MKPKKALIITGPSGVGKTYLAEQLSKLYPELFEPVKLFTTRKPRSNEQFVDRIFITQEEFADKQKNQEIIFAGGFHGNQYGYTFAALHPTSKHLIVNAWPSFIPKFTSFPNVVLLGLTIEPTSLPLLKLRMLNRGDTQQQVAERTPLIMRDMQDLKKLKPIIEQDGKVFTITDDTTIAKLVLPWVMTALAISPSDKALQVVARANATRRDIAHIKNKSPR